MAESVSPVIHQALHGYADGHTLLAASCDLTPTEKKALLLLSDLSGQIGSRSFDSYLTGYPLPGKRYYALARTWSAPEMPRPGCVWTQTLLLALPLLTRIADLSELNQLFKRPQLGYGNNYSVAISADKLIHSTFRSLYNPNSSFYDIAYHLYNKTKDAVLIPAESAELYEEDILNIWRQQWPRLRRSFSFCTGSLSIREVDGKLLDCQVVPEGYSSRLSRNHTGSISAVDFSIKNKAANWFEVYKWIDLQKLQEFMYKYGSDIAGKRSKFGPLCIAYAILNYEQEGILSFDDTLSFFKQYFSPINEARKLKRDLINKIIELTPNGEYNLIRTILTSPDISLIPEMEWNTSEQILKLWSEEKISKNEVNRLLEELDTSRLSESQRFQLLSKLPVEIWLDIRWVTDTLLSDIIATTPHIIEQAYFWKSTVSNQRLGVDLLLNLKRNEADKLLARVVPAMLDAQNDRWAATLSATFGRSALRFALEWLRDDSQALLSPNWQELVYSHPYEYLAWLASSQQFTEQANELMLQLLVMKNFRIDLLDHKFIKILLAQLPKIQFSIARNQAMAIWLAKGLNGIHPTSKEITALLFQPLYDIVIHDDLEYSSWLILAPRHERPMESFSLSKIVNRIFSEEKPQPEYWDKCGQLRQKIVESCILLQWPSETLFKAITNKDAFEAVIKYCLQFESGRELFERLFRFAQQSKVYKNSFYPMVMKSELDKTRKSKKKRK